MASLTKEEAIQKMREGNKVTHIFFTDKEWVMSNSNGTTYTLEDGVQCSPREFWMYRTDKTWETDWEIFNN